MNSAIENHIRKNESYKITSAIQTNRNRGMILLDENLYQMYRDGKITREETELKAQNPTEMKKRLDYLTLGGAADKDSGNKKDANGGKGDETVGGIFRKKS